MFNIEQNNPHAYWQFLQYDTIEESTFYRHMHNELEILFITKGNGVFNIDGNEIEVSEYDLVIIPPHSYHVLKVNKERVYERFVFNFPLDYYDIDLSKISDKPHVYNLSNHYDIIENFNKIREYSESLKDDDFVKVLHLYMQLILIQLKNTVFDDGTSKSANHITASALRYIDDHLFEPLDITIIAKALYISKSHLQNTFYKSMRIGLKTYIIQRKMDKAQTMLNESMRAQEVAEKLGYKTYSTFYKSYMNVYGRPPKTIRKKKRN